MSFGDFRLLKEHGTKLREAQGRTSEKCDCWSVSAGKLKNYEVRRAHVEVLIVGSLRAGLGAKWRPIPVAGQFADASFEADMVQHCAWRTRPPWRHDALVAWVGFA